MATPEKLLVLYTGGTIGMQICADASWSESWQALKRQGAEVVLFPSQASYGQALNHHARVNHFNIVSSTGEKPGPDIKVRDILREYQLPTCDEQIKEATALQEKFRL